MRITAIKIIVALNVLFLCACTFLQSPESANKVTEFNVFLPKNNAGKGAITIGNNLTMNDLLSRADNRCKEVQMQVNPASIIKKECGPYSCFYGYECMVNANPVSSTPTRQSQVTIDEAKGKCKDLGFKGGSEDFGKCVLRLTK